MDITVEVKPATILDNTSFKGTLAINLKDHIRKIREDGGAVCTLRANSKFAKHTCFILFQSKMNGNATLANILCSLF